MSFLLPLFMSSGGGTTPPPIIVNELAAFRAITVEPEVREVYIEAMPDFVSGTSSVGAVDGSSRVYFVGEEVRIVECTPPERICVIPLEKRLVFA